jgi:hypothetical protein
MDFDAERKLPSLCFARELRMVFALHVPPFAWQMAEQVFF